MVRPTLLVAEHESVQALSVRKLVLETAKFNVLTAYGLDEALRTFDLFPRVAGVVVAFESPSEVNTVAKYVRDRRPEMQVIALGPVPGNFCPDAQHHVSSHDPEELLHLVRRLFGDPRQSGEAVA